MKTQFKIPLLMALFGFGALCVPAQMLQPFVVNNSGGLLQNSSVNVEWSLGELAVVTIGSPDYSLTQGFLQPLLDSTTGVSNHFVELKKVAFPNPVSSQLFFETSLPDIATVSVYDVLGKLILETDFTPELDMRGLSNGMYFIALFDQKRQSIYAFKIIKN